MARRNGLRVDLGKKKFLVSDGLSYWIVREQKPKKSDGDPYDVRLSGYHLDLESLFDSYFDRTIMDSGAEDIEELGKAIKKVRAEIRKWIKEIKEVSK